MQIGSFALGERTVRQRLCLRLFIVLPEEMQQHTDWRMAIFECGQHIVAFDGDALLLREIWQRERNKPSL